MTPPERPVFVRTERVDIPPFGVNADAGAAAETHQPVDAATLIVVRGDAVLMGKRAASHVFMPDKWVFPGGAVDEDDALKPAERELAPEVEALLRYNGVSRPPRAFALAAARELREEAGLTFGGTTGPRLDQFVFICRAITPPGGVRCFDARFFIVDAEHLTGDPAPSAEMPELRWTPLQEAMALDAPRVTRFVLGLVAQHLIAPRQAEAVFLDGAHMTGGYLRLFAERER